MTTLDEPAPTDRPDRPSRPPRPSRNAAPGRSPRTHGSTARRKSRKPFRKFLIVSHRWTSLVLGLFLVVITTSGALLVYRPELERAMNRDAWTPVGSTRLVSMQQAYDTVKAAHPDDAATNVIYTHGVYKVTDYETAWTVDPTTGRILGHIDETPAWIGFLDNLHECFLDCESMPGYMPFFAKQIPYTSWLGFSNGDEPAEDITVGSFSFGVLGVLLIFLCFSGLWLWFPRPSKWKSSMNVRWSKGRFARDTDLHKVAGMIVLLPLFVWGLTGAGFRIGPVADAWYALTPGEKIVYPEVTSAEGKGKDIGMDAAIRAASHVVPKGSVPVTASMPDEEDATATYSIFFSNGVDPYAQGDSPGNLGVDVDRRTGDATITYGSPQASVAEQLWQTWNFPVHTGYVVNGWWRLIWFVAGLSPLLLTWTGVSTWLVREGNKRRRKKAKKNAPPRGGARAGAGAAGASAPKGARAERPAPVARTAGPDGMASGAAKS